MIGTIKASLKKLILGVPSKKKYKFIIKDWIQLTDIDACRKVLSTTRFFRNIQPLELDVPDARSILVIAPHPDDDILGPGGTLLKAIQNGAKVNVVYVADGTRDSEQAKRIRAETLNVCEAAGTKPFFLGCRNGEIPLGGSSAAQKLYDLITEEQPEVLFITFLLDDHDDHRRVNHLLLSLFQDKPIPDVEIWSYQIYSSILPNVVVDITDVALKKSELISMWSSVSGNRDWAHYMLGINATNCRYISTPGKVYVEGFFTVPIKEYLSLCSHYFSEDVSDIYYGELYRGK